MGSPEEGEHDPNLEIHQAPVSGLKKNQSNSLHNLSVQKPVSSKHPGSSPGISETASPGLVLNFSPEAVKKQNSQRLSELEGTLVVIHANANPLFFYSCIYSPNRYLLNTFRIQAQYWVLAIQPQSDAWLIPHGI